MDPDSFLPQPARLHVSDEAYATTPYVVAHVMPFSIDYTGPAPVDAYLVLQKPDGSRPSDLSTDEEAVSAFRGRRIHGSRLQLPESYKLGFFQMREDDISETPVSKPPASRTRPTTQVGTVMNPPAPIRGSRFTLEDDENDDENEDVEEQAQQADSSMASSPTSLSVKEDPTLPELIKPRHYLEPVASGGDSVWIWGPDGPIDSGDDPYIRTCKEWLSVIAPAVRYPADTVARRFVRYQLDQFEISDYIAHAEVRTREALGSVSKLDDT